MPGSYMSRMEAEEIDNDNLNRKQKYTCVICKKECTGYGHSAVPLSKGKCCGKCNKEKVIPERRAQYEQQ